MDSPSQGPEEWRGGFDVHSDPEEIRHLYSVLDSFRQYRRIAHLHTTHVRRQYFYALPTAHWTILSEPPISFLETLSALDDAIDKNANLAEKIMRMGADGFGVNTSAAATETDLDPPWKNAASKLDMDKCRSTMHQLFRDWSTLGEPERRVCYGPVMDDLHHAFPQRHTSHVEVLVPGAGLARLVYDLAKEGYHAEGNEFSYHQLITSSFILNHTEKAEEYALHPFVMSFANVQSRKDQLRQVLIPDEHPRSLQSSGSMCMTTGDFVSVYSEEEHRDRFDAVATVFFIDTAQNLIRYIETVRKCLKTGGIWTNVGPLLWHFGHHNSPSHASEGDSSSDAGRETPNEHEYGSFELCDEEVVALIQRFGFEVEKHEACCGETGYVQNPASMLQSIYRPSHWRARKK